MGVIIRKGRIRFPVPSEFVVQAIRYLLNRRSRGQSEQFRNASSSAGLNRRAQTAMASKMHRLPHKSDGTALRNNKSVRKPAVIFPCKMAKHVFITFFTGTEYNNLDIILTQLIHHVCNQIEALSGQSVWIRYRLASSCHSAPAPYPPAAGHVYS